MKTEPRHYRLGDAIRRCYPPHVREQLEISSITVCHNNEPAMTIVRIGMCDESHCYDTEALLALLEADKIERQSNRSVIRGCYAGRLCEIQLVLQTSPNYA